MCNAAVYQPINYGLTYINNNNNNNNLKSKISVCCLYAMRIPRISKKKECKSLHLSHVCCCKNPFDLVQDWLSIIEIKRWWPLFKSSWSVKLYLLAANVVRWRRLQPVASDSEEYVIDELLQLWLVYCGRGEVLEHWLVGIDDVIVDAPIIIERWRATLLQRQETEESDQRSQSHVA